MTLDTSKSKRRGEKFATFGQLLIEFRPVSSRLINDQILSAHSSCTPATWPPSTSSAHRHHHQTPTSAHKSIKLDRVGVLILAPIGLQQVRPSGRLPDARASFRRFGKRERERERKNGGGRESSVGRFPSLLFEDKSTQDALDLRAQMLQRKLAATKSGRKCATLCLARCARQICAILSKNFARIVQQVAAAGEG